MTVRTAELARMTVLDAASTPIELGALWRDRTAVLVFVRHFGCIHCREHVVRLQRDVERIHAAGAEMIVIGNGTPNFIEGFREQTGFRGPLYTDPSLAVYQAAALERGVMKTLDPRGLGAAVKALAGGRRQGWQQGDQWQQGGVLAIAPDGRVVYHHASARPGDNASAGAILAALTSP
jgi:peroxiredoxin